MVHFQLKMRSLKMVKLLLKQLLKQLLKKLKLIRLTWHLNRPPALDLDAREPRNLG